MPLPVHVRALARAVSRQVVRPAQASALALLGLLLVACGAEDDAPAQLALDGGAWVSSDATASTEGRDDGGDAGEDTPVARVDASTPAGPEPGLLAGFTAEHNAARARALTTTPLPALRWSDELAAVAQTYAEALAASCSDTLVHSSSEQRRGWGENLASFTITGGKGSEPNGTAHDTVALWESELSCYTFGPFAPGVNATCSEACRAHGGCGHLTQMLWRSTERVGCGVSECREGRTRKSYWVCNYDPPGNFPGQLPY